MRSLRHRVTAAAATTALAATLWSGIAAADEAPAPEAPSPAVQLLAQLNARRADAGLAPLALEPEPVAVAQRWAEAMAANGRIAHRADLTEGMPSTWRNLGENVGTGPTIDDIHRAFVASPTHDANLVEPRYTSVGIGVAEVDGQLYVAEEFLTTMPATAARPPAVHTRRGRSRSSVRHATRRTQRTTARGRVL
jgi:uncharacterized protein YkwD